MSYSTSNPPRMIVGSLENNAPNIWVYSTTDASTVVDAANYFTNAQALGMKAGDLVISLTTGGPTIQLHIVLTVAASGADLSDGIAITATNSR